MPQLISRRFFLAATSAALLASRISSAVAQVPALLDHILLGCNDLDRGVAFVEEHTGVRPAFGGVHPGRGTRNALVSLGVRHYLEVIAPDPQQPGATDSLGLRNLSEPRLVSWAAHPGDLDALAKRLGTAGVAFTGPTAGSRARPDGKTLHWKTLNLADDRHGLLPFFIEWSADSVHPSADAPKGCHLVRFSVSAPDPAELRKTFQLFGLDPAVEQGTPPQLRARVSGPKGHLDLTS
jgi:catechol 2,3-dioxygenase-like lactoylglutathione lyase family enzyme